jgi:hypothetical protein
LGNYFTIADAFADLSKPHYKGVALQGARLFRAFWARVCKNPLSAVLPGVAKLRF